MIGLKKLMDKFRLLIENFVIYGLGSIIGKFIPFVMLPVVTRMMPSTEYFGINDLSNTIVSFAGAVAGFGMYDAMYRFFFEREDCNYKKDICSTALVFTILTSIAVCLLLLITRGIIADFFFQDKSYSYVVIVSAFTVLVSSTNGIVSAPTRMQNKRGIYIAVNTFVPVVTYIVAIFFLWKGYYVIALPAAAFISGIMTQGIFIGLNHEWFNLKRFKITYLKEMLPIAIPVIPSFLLYWVFNSSDRVMISNLLNVSDVGVYSIGSKLGAASSLIYAAFVSGWQYFVFSTMKTSDQTRDNSIIFEYLGVISFVSTAFICAVSHAVYSIFFTGSYLSGYLIAPYLFLAPLLLMLYQTLAGKFAVDLKTWPNVVILLLGAVVNILLNWILIPRIGIEGAAVATLFGYVVVCLICVAVMIKLHAVVVRKRFVFITLLMVIYFVSWRFFLSESFVCGLLGAVAFTGTCITIYWQDIKVVAAMVKNLGGKGE